MAAMGKTIPHLPFPPFKKLVGESLKLKVIDVGANPSDGEPAPYAALLAAGDAELVGFEPHAPSLAVLNAQKGPHETYLPHAVGDGGRHTLRSCNVASMDSLLAPNPAVMKLFHLFSYWSKVTGSTPVDTVRLDDVPETAGADMLCIDIQGAELLAFAGARQRLRDVAVIHAETSFVQMYAGQPLFSEIEQFLRAEGFMLHRFSPLVGRIVSPFMIDTEVYAEVGQLVYADAVFVRDLARVDLIEERQLLAGAAIVHDCYGSVDVAFYLLRELDRRKQTDLSVRYMNALSPFYPGRALWAWTGPSQSPAGS